MFRHLGFLLENNQSEEKGKFKSFTEVVILGADDEERFLVEEQGFRISSSSST